MMCEGEKVVLRVEKLFSESYFWVCGWMTSSGPLADLWLAHSKVYTKWPLQIVPRQLLTEI